MYARVTSTQILPGKIDEAIRIYRDSVVPAAREQKGFTGAYELVDRGTGKSLSVSLWDTEADMLAGETSGYLREQVAKFGAVIVGPPTTEHYEVGVQA
jgi:heme-degrading monooxygenase HmoA